jgi:hypothetical protein
VPGRRLASTRIATPRLHADRTGPIIPLHACPFAGGVALARSLRPAAAIPGARSWAELEATGSGALQGVGGHLALQPPPSLPGGQPDPDGDGGAPLMAGYRLRLAVITAAREGDAHAATALIREGQRQGLDPGWLLAVAARYWPPPRLRVRAWRAGRRWITGSLRRLQRPRQPATAAAAREARP